ncbi:hypothetical protein I552_4519 [Mycobacterium xenopi 3993]|nr:hypothetical protein I552_4519 [Mycobacterium xenopi 3993]
MVPSIGSMIHCRPLKAVAPPNSSPTMSSSGRLACSASRTSDSTARSASVTGVRSGFVSIRKSSAPNRAIVTASARSASINASARSWPMQQSYHWRCGLGNWCAASADRNAGGVAGARFIRRGRARTRCTARYWSPA